MTSPDRRTALEVERPILDAYWVSPGRVLAGEYPGSVDLEDAWPKLRWLLETGVSAFVDLTESGELEPYLKVLAAEADRLGAAPEHQRRPIRDASTPTVEAMTEILDAIDATVESGKVVYLHCMAGLGRTGVVVGCYLVRPRKVRRGGTRGDRAPKTRPPGRLNDLALHGRPAKHGTGVGPVIRRSVDLAAHRWYRCGALSAALGAHVPRVHPRAGRTRLAGGRH